jgi:hypothetical protein
MPYKGLISEHVGPFSLRSLVGQRSNPPDYRRTWSFGMITASEKLCSQKISFYSIVSTTNLIRTALGQNLCLRDGMPATNFQLHIQMGKSDKNNNIP